MTNKLLIIAIFFTASTTLCLAKKTTIAVAANAQYAIKEIAKQYENETGKGVEVIVGSSGKLAAQIREGAPFDVFLSADMEFPQTLFKEGLTTDVPKIYGYGSLVLWTTKDVQLLNINVLLLPDVLHIAIANPKIAPYGEAAVNVMNYYKLYEKVQAKIIYGESISQVNQYITSKTADIGFTAMSVVLSPEMKGLGKWIQIDKKAYQPIAQGAVLLKSVKGRNVSEATQFYNYIYSEKAAKVFEKYGYQVPK